MAESITVEFTSPTSRRSCARAVRKFCADNFDEQTVRRLMESDPPFDRKVWARLGAELGVLGLSVPEADGGVGGTLVDQAVAVEELGAALACGPLFGTVFLAIPALVAASRGRGARRVAAPIWSRAAAPRRSPSPTGPARSTRRTVTVTVGTATPLTGTVERVVDGGAADDLLVAATGPDGVALYAVEAAGAGCATHPAGRRST